MARRTATALHGHFQNDFAARLRMKPYGKANHSPWRPTAA